MGKYFGTDGVRGKANETLTVEMAYKVGRYLGYYYGLNGKSKVVIGKDTRLSSSMFEAAITAGCLESGADVYQVGYTSTPSIAYLASTQGFNCGIMISASHNPFFDNGIKIFKNDGTKLDSEVEDMIEEYFEHELNLKKASSEEIGKLFNYQNGIDLYLDFVESVVHPDLKNYKLAIDLANGSNCYTAKRLFDRLGVDADFFFHEPDGININNDCGSTHLGKLQEIMKSGKYDIGFAFDGDADRVLAVNKEGRLIDGDTFLYICGKYLSKTGELKDNTIVTTVMSNIGLFKALEKAGLKADVTAVGDKYVFKSMTDNGYFLGGEQSGHLIFKKYANSGDGLLSALMLLEVISKENKSLEELSIDLKIYPQLLVNVRVKDKSLVHDQDLLDLIKEIEIELGDDGRVLVRTSGTEQLIRVMVEAASDEICNQCVYRMVDLIKEKDSRL